MALPGGSWAGPRLSDLVSDPDSAAAIGAAYLRENPALASRSRLLRQLALPQTLPNRGRLASLMERRISSDFENQRVLVLNGWLVSRSEAAICGLIALG